MNQLQLRPVTVHDAYALWIWANDAETRAASHGRPPIAWADHFAWVQSKSASDQSLFLIAESDNAQPVGTIRFDTTDNWATARLSYGLAPEARGQGLSRPLVAAGVKHLRTRFPSCVPDAEVIAGNERSLRVFRALGWSETSENDTHHFRALTDREAAQ